MTRSRTVLSFLGTLLFLGGITVGQQSTRSNLTKYEETMNISRIEWLVLKTNMSEIIGRLPTDEFGMGPTSYAFNPQSKQIRATVFVMSNMLDKLPTEEVRETLSATARGSYAFAQTNVPDLSENDFEMVFFRNLTVANFRGRQKLGPIYAEYKAGKLILH